MIRCLGCMEEYDEKYNVCPHCGYVVNQKAKLPIHMNPGTVLKSDGKEYTIGRVVGSGSFGVTYVAWDSMLERKVAIKEYLPSEYATRAMGSCSVEIYTDKSEAYKSGMKKFIDEARRLAKVENTKGIVKVYDQFYENDTAYIVMEYLDGETLSEYLEEKGKIDAELAVDMLMPVMEALIELHKEGILHRDIAPDNIMITKDGEVKLIDFGAARYALIDQSKSLSVIVKQGYSAEEQYRKKGEQGPHTDVYSIAATLYKMITGNTPPDALERRAGMENGKKNLLEPIGKTTKDISENVEKAIYNGLNVKKEDRTETVEKFIEELKSDKVVVLRSQTIELIDRFGWKKWQKLLVGAIVAIIIGLFVLLGTGVIKFTNPYEKEIDLADGMTRVPSIVNKEIEVAEQMLVEGKLLYSIEGKEYSRVIPKDYVLSQDIKPGTVTEINTMLQLRISGGPEMIELPNILGLDKETALGMLDEIGISGDIVEEYNEYIESGCVIGQGIEEGTLIAKGDSIEVIISKGADPTKEKEEKIIIVPKFVGLKYSEVLKLAEETEVIIEVSKRSYTDKYEKDVIMSQSVAEGVEMSNKEVISLEVSLGVKYITVPDVTYCLENDAANMLESRGITVTKRYEESETVKEGLVISQSIEDGKRVVEGEKVEIVISKGKASFKMPNVVGKEEKKAVEELQGKGLNVKLTYKSDKSAEGNVISQSIGEGETVTSGTVVTLVISTGSKATTAVKSTVKTTEKPVEETSRKVTENTVITTPTKDVIVNEGTTEYIHNESGVKIVSNPQSVTAALGNIVTMSVKATGEGLKYQWEYKTATGTSWKSLGSAYTTPTITFEATAVRNGNQYSCVITDSNGKSVTTDAATLTVSGQVASINITKQPTNVTTALGTNATFAVQATGTGLKYQWQYKTATGTSWKSLGSAYTTPTITFEATAVRNGNQYSCVITDSNGKSVTTDYATLIVN